jgi:hypothetical protein
MSNYFDFYLFSSANFITQSHQLKIGTTPTLTSKKINWPNEDPITDLSEIFSLSHTQ